MNIITEKLNQIYLQENKISIINELYSRDVETLSNFLNEGFIKDKIDKLSQSHKKNIKLADKFLIDQGFSVSKMKNKGQVLANSIKSSIKNREKPEVIQSKLTKGALKIIKEEALSMKEKFDEKTVGQKNY